MPKILLIDDEPDILRLLALSLRADGHEVVTAPNGEEGLAAFAEHAYDIVLVDIKMPGTDGIDVLKAVKQGDALSEVIIVTGHGDVDNAVEALKHGASDFLNKPVRDEALAVAIARAGEKLAIRRELRDHTLNLEAKVEAATRALKRQARFQEKLIRSSNDGIVATDRELRIVVFNPGAESIFGYRHGEVVGRLSISDIYPEAVAAAFQAGREGEDVRFEIPWQEASIRSRTGEGIPVRFSGSILREGGEVMGTVAFFQDLREIKELERELVRRERLAAVGQTIAGVAHGVKNILHGLKGGRHLVDVGIERDDGDRLRRGWDMVGRNIDRTSDLVMDLLRYSKERTPEWEECRPNDIGREVCELVRERADAGAVSIVEEYDSAIGTVTLDPRSLHTVLLNLMSNAVDACLDDPAPGKARRVVLRTRREGDGAILFEVADNGVGMAPEVQERLFTSFFSTKGHRGTGLGLMVTRKLVEEDGGRVEVASAPGLGTTFSVRLPVRPARTR
jgi:PAS domain S-box-containing protein